MDNEQTPSLVQTLSYIQTNLKAHKNLHNSFGGYSYRSCEGILEALKPYLKDSDLALIISDELVCIGDRFYVKATAIIKDSEGGEISSTAYAREPEQKKGMDSAQLTGATSSYARKYALNGLFCIDDNKDADSMDNSVEVEQTKFLNDNQVKLITNKAKEVGVDIDVICNAMKVESLNEIKEVKYNAIIKRLESKQATKMEASGNV